MNSHDGMDEVFDDGDDDWGHTGLTKEVFYQFAMAILHAMKDDQISDRHCLVLLISSMNDDVTSTEFDLLPELREALIDWPDNDKDQIKDCKILQIRMPSGEGHECKAGHDEHLAQVVSIHTQSGWDWTQVRSNVNFEQVLGNVAEKYLPRDNDGEVDRRLMLAASSPSLREGFDRAMKQNIEAEVGKFRSELDAIFPTAPEGGDHDANPGPE